LTQDAATAVKYRYDKSKYLDNSSLNIAIFRWDLYLWIFWRWELWI